MSLAPIKAAHKVLALDTSTERMTVALGAAGQPPLAVLDAEGGAQASATLLPGILRLLRSVGWRLAELDAIAFGCGPGAFTGLRTTCAVVQGLAVAARPGGIPVIPVHTLLAVAQQGLAQWLQTHGAWPGGYLSAAIDARMDEMYVADVAVHPATSAGNGKTWSLKLAQPALLCAPEALATHTGWPALAGPPPVLLAGNAAAVYGGRWPLPWQAVPQVSAGPTAQAVLALSAQLWAEGAALPAAAAQPLYIRDKVAQTTLERAAVQASQTAAPSSFAPSSTPGGKGP